MRRVRRSGLVAFTVLLLLATSLAFAGPAAGGTRATRDSRLLPSVTREARHDVSPALRSIDPLSGATASARAIRQLDRLPTVPRGTIAGTAGAETTGDDAVQTRMPRPNMPSPAVVFDGIDNADNLAIQGFRLSPPDPTIAVGPDHIVETVNLLFQIFDKSGSSLYGPAKTSAMWSGFGGLCETTDSGDPVTLYDELADRFFVSKFAFTDLAGPHHMCITVSTSGDPTGTWYRYDFTTSATELPDYPKFGVWPDGYYMSANEFAGSGTTYSGVLVAAFDRDSMLNGDPATMISFDLGDTYPLYYGMLPSDLDGPAPPPEAPNVFMEVDDASVFGDAADTMRLAAFADAVYAGDATVTGSAGRTYCYRAYAFDNAGNLSGPSSPDICTAIPLNDDRLTATGSWTRRHRAGYYLGDYSESTNAGDFLKLSGVRATRLSVVVTKGPGYGKLRVLWNGVVIGTINLDSASVKKRQIVLLPAFGGAESGTAKLEVVTNGKIVRVEGFGVSHA